MFCGDSQKQILMQPKMARLKTALNACFRPPKRALGPRQPYLGAKLLLFFELTKFFGKDLQNEKVLIISANSYF